MQLVKMGFFHNNIDSLLATAKYNALKVRRDLVLQENVRFTPSRCVILLVISEIEGKS